MGRPGGRDTSDGWFRQHNHQDNISLPPYLPPRPLLYLCLYRPHLSLLYSSTEIFKGTFFDTLYTLCLRLVLVIKKLLKKCHQQAHLQYLRAGYLFHPLPFCVGCSALIHVACVSSHQHTSRPSNMAARRISYSTKGPFFSSSSSSCSDRVLTCGILTLTF